MTKNPPLILILLLNFGIISISYSEISLPKHLTTQANLKNNGDYVRTRFLQNMKNPFTNIQKKKALIIGDSHAQDFFNGLLENNFLSHYQISTRYIPTRCQIYLADDMLKFTNKEDRELCAKSDNLLHAQQQIKQADLIILVASWRDWSARELPKTLSNMKINSKQKLFVIGRKSFSKPILNYSEIHSKDELAKIRNHVDAHQLKINEIMKKSLDKRLFINLHKLICGEMSTSCPAFSDDLKRISFDGGHFTKEGARYITKILFNKSPLGNL